jgi:hypothetical protein
MAKAPKRRAERRKPDQVKRRSGKVAVPDADVVAVTRKIDFERVSQQIEASSGDFRERHRVRQDDLSLEVSF